MMFVTVGGITYNLAQLVKFKTHIGQREVGATESVVDPQPIFGDFQYLELVFSDGAKVELDEAQTRAFLPFLRNRAPLLDLDKVEEAILGEVLVHGTEEGGDIILAREEAGEAPAAPIVKTDPADR